MPKGFKKRSAKELSAPLTAEVLMETLAEFSEGIIAPQFRVLEERMKQYTNSRVGAAENRIMDYVDKRIATQTAEIFGRLDKRYEDDRQFKTRIVTLFKKHKIGSSKDIAFFEGYLAARP